MKPQFALLFAILAAGTAALAQGPPPPSFWQQQAQLTASEGGEFSYFGSAVAISGNTAVVGASGHVYVFARVAGAWKRQKMASGSDELIPFGSVVGGYGASVAISGDTVIVAHGPKAHIFRRNGLAWKEEQTLHPIGSTRITSVGISGDTAIFGAAGEDNGRGAVYVFVREDNVWSGQAHILANDPTPINPDGDQFGWAVAISGDTAIIGAPGDEVIEHSIIPQGSAYVWVRSGKNWSQQKRLAADPSSDNTFYLGSSVAISGDMAVSGEGSAGNAAYVFERTGTNWSNGRYLAPNAGEVFTGEGYGASVAISGHTAIVGAPHANSNQGAAIVFVRVNGLWSQQDKLTALGSIGTPPGGSNFGDSVAVSGNTMIGGAPFDRVGDIRDRGAAYAFQALDSDGDALPDHWEIHGVTIDGQFIDLPGMGANPMHKDIFVHVDWMVPGPTGVIIKPKWRAMMMVMDAFAIAPVENPDGKSGINLHVDVGPDSTLNPHTGQTWGALSRSGEVPFQMSVDWKGVETVKTAHFSPSKRSSVFHYVLFCNTIDGNVRILGQAQAAPSPDFLVAFGDPTWPTPGGTALDQAATFMHELGHNLGLEHGGKDEINGKPNYISIMNYRFSHGGTLNPVGPGMFNVFGQRTLDYSREALPTLDELLLNEPLGIGDPLRHFTTWNRLARPTSPPGVNKAVENPNGYYKLFHPGSALDWDCDGQQDFNLVEADINGDGVYINPGPNRILETTPSGDDDIRRDINGRDYIVSGPNRICETTAAGDDVHRSDPGDVEPRLLEGFDDWEVIVFEGGGRLGALAVPDTDGVSTPIDEPTIEELLDAVPPALLEAHTSAPLDEVTVSTLGGGAPQSVTFDGGASTAVTGTVVSWSWDFGDGTTGSGSVVTHNYTAPGTYFAKLTVLDSEGRINLVPLLHRVNVGTGPPAPAPNLGLHQPAGWSDKLVISKTTGTNADDAPWRSNEPLYVDFAIVNRGNAAPQRPLRNKLLVDGVVVLELAGQAGAQTIVYEDFPIGVLSAGQHSIEIVTDADGEIAESDETDNTYSRTITVAAAPPALPNFSPHQPAGWSDKLVVSSAQRTHTDESPLLSTDNLYVDFAVINNGTANLAGAFVTNIYVDGVGLYGLWSYPPLAVSSHHAFEDLPIGPLSVGQHTIRIVVDDVQNQVPESDETDNTYTRTINVVAPPPPSPFPLVVTTSVDNGNDTNPTLGSLRYAIKYANGNPNSPGEVDRIVFNIPGSGVQTIRPPVVLPTITDPVIIDGYTQPGSSPNTLAIGNNAVLLIELDGTNVADWGLKITGGNSTVRGLVVNRFRATSFTEQLASIQLSSSNNIVAGNFLGINAGGTTAISNRLGVGIDAGANNLVGGVTPADRNIIAGGATNGFSTGGVGVYTSEPGTRIQGNYIGTNAAGTAPLGHGGAIGVGVRSHRETLPGIIIGGLTDRPGTGAGNLISGNGPRNGSFFSSAQGIAFTNTYRVNRTGDIVIQGNIIGLNATGTAELRNEHSGIAFDDDFPGVSKVLIGGTVPGARNIIAGNFININGVYQSGLTVQGNFVGTDITGTVAMGGIGISSNGASTLVGGTSAGAGNVISGNGLGLNVRALGSTTIQGNLIGTTVDGITPLPNGTTVRIEKDAIAVIGGTGPGAGNVIANGKFTGIVVEDTARATILGNSIYHNGTTETYDLGIDLNEDWVTANDAGDGDTGPNGLQNYPVLTSAFSSCGGTYIAGTFNSKADTVYRIEFFSNVTREHLGHGEGQTLLGSTNVTTDGGSNAAINVVFPVYIPAGRWITATATDPEGNTSEFSAAIESTTPIPVSGGTFSLTPLGQVLPGTIMTGTAAGWTATMAPLTYEFRLDGIPVGVASPAPILHFPAPAAPGEHTLTLRIYDRCGDFAETSQSFVVNHPPVARDWTLGAVDRGFATFSVEKLLLRASDADGDAISIIAVSPFSTMGGTVRLRGLITYTPPYGYSGPDSFTYTMVDARGGISTGTVNVMVTAAADPSLNVVSITPTAEGFLVKFAGIPGARYVIEFTNSLSGSPVSHGPPGSTEVQWQVLTPPGPIVAGPNGLFEFEDKPNPLPPSRFYRAAEAP